MKTLLKRMNGWDIVLPLVGMLLLYMWLDVGFEWSYIKSGWTIPFYIIVESIDVGIGFGMIAWKCERKEQAIIRIIMAYLIGRVLVGIVAMFIYETNVVGDLAHQFFCAIGLAQDKIIDRPRMDTLMGIPGAVFAVIWVHIRSKRANRQTEQAVQ